MTSLRITTTTITTGVSYLYFPDEELQGEWRSTRTLYGVGNNGNCKLKVLLLTIIAYSFL
jgi:hypothetical protein